MLKDSLDDFKHNNRGHAIDVLGVVINNAFYDGGNAGGPERRTALPDIRSEAKKNGWYVFIHQLPHSRGYPKLMRGDYNLPGKAQESFDPLAVELIMKLQ